MKRFEHIMPALISVLFLWEQSFKASIWIIWGRFTLEAEKRLQCRISVTLGRYTSRIRTNACPRQLNISPLFFQLSSCEIWGVILKDNWAVIVLNAVNAGLLRLLVFTLHYRNHSFKRAPWFNNGVHGSCESGWMCTRVVINVFGSYPARIYSRTRIINYGKVSVQEV